MDNLYIEQRSPHGQDSLSWDIARHLYNRQLEGNIVIVAQTPQSLLASVRKQWWKVVRQVKRERSGTLDATRIYELNNLTSHMQSIRMRMKRSDEEYDANIKVLFATAEQLQDSPPTCTTMYVTVPLPEKTLKVLTSRMPDHALLVKYILP